MDNYYAEIPTRAGKLPVMVQQMKVVALSDCFELLYLKPDNGVEVLARVPFTQADRLSKEMLAEMLAASLVMFDAISNLLEHAQPDGWDPNDDGAGEAWANAFNAHAMATGQVTPFRTVLTEV